MPFTPGDPWPSDTPGGAAPLAWGGYVRFWLLAEIAAGLPFTLGQHPNDRLNAGNALGDASVIAYQPDTPDPAALPTTGRLWADLSCDIVDVEIAAGSGTGHGILSKAEAGTLSVELYDPTGRYDPFNPSTPFALNGRSRLIPGVRVLAFCEIVSNPTATPATVIQVPLFSGTADRWSQEWAKEPSDRRGRMVATDFTKRLVKMDRAEQPPVGAGEAVITRLNRIADYFSFNRPTQWVTGGTRTLAATTLAQSAWELMNRAIDDELGYLWVIPSTAAAFGAGIVWTPREAWSDTSLPVIQLGCGGPGFFDIVTDATPLGFDADMLNTVAASRSGGTAQSASNPASVNRWGEKSHSRTDLGLADDTQAATWAQDLVNLSAFPRQALEQIKMQPQVAPNSWAAFASGILTPMFVLRRARVVYENDNFDYTVDVTVRAVGYTHRITADTWEVEWRTVSADVGAMAQTFHMGPDAFDRLDAGNVLAA